MEKRKDSKIPILINTSRSMKKLMSKIADRLSVMLKNVLTEYNELVDI